MEASLAALEGTAVAQALRFSRWGYAAVNAAHIFGIALLVGSIIPLNLRIFGIWRSVPRSMLVRVLVPVAATGLAIAVTAGFLLFSTRALEYAGNEFLQLKLVLVAVGATSAITLHSTHGVLLEDAGRGRLIGHAVVSTTCWLGALACGRLIAFTGD